MVYKMTGALKVRTPWPVLVTLTLMASTLALGSGTAHAESTGGRCEGKSATHNTRIVLKANSTIYYGSSGNDVIVATSRTQTPGPVVVFAGAGADTVCVVGHEGSVWGGSGRDTLIGGPYVDVLVGGGHDDVIKGNGSSDLIQGGWGNDHLYGGWGNDDIDGQAGYDRVYGYRGYDKCQGEVESSCER